MTYNFYVLNWLMGRSSYFISGGPGRGMHCRASRIIGGVRDLEDIETVMSVFRNRGVFGLHFRAGQGSVSDFGDKNPNFLSRIFWVFEVF